MCSRPDRATARLRRGIAWALIVVGGAAVGVAAASDEGSVLTAVKGGNDALLRTLLAENADPNDADADGTSALHWAVHHGELELASALLAAGAAADAANRYGVRPLYLAAENGDAAMVRALLDAGADPNGVFAEGETVLMTAARTGSVAVIEALVAAGADVHAAEDRKGQNALMWAAAENNASAVRALLAAGAALDARSAGDDFTALAFAARAGAVDSARALLDAGADPDTALRGGATMLVLATINANFELASLLLDYGADPNADAQGWTALHQIAWARRWTRGFNLPGPEHADDFSSLDLVRKLAAHGADVNARQTRAAPPRYISSTVGGNRGETPFLLATKSVDLPLMRTLLDVGADPTLADDEGTTAVMAAAGANQGLGSAGSMGSIEEAIAAVELALEAGGGTVNDVNMNNETPLHGAMYRGGAISLIDFLVARGADTFDTVNSRGWTPLRVADGVALDGAAFIRFPDAAARLRHHMRERGLPVPPVEWDGPEGQAIVAR